jgi:hypothetical protein
MNGVRANIFMIISSREGLILQSTEEIDEEDLIEVNSQYKPHKPSDTHQEGGTREDDVLAI